MFNQLIIILDSLLHVILNWFEVRVVHGVLRGNSLSVVVSQHVVQQVDGLLGNK